jgi:YidC/Oxa1 family membrane protein insertase
VDNQRLFLLAALGVVMWLLWSAWQQDYGTQKAPASTTTPPAAQSAPQKNAQAPRAPASGAVQPKQQAAPVKLAPGRAVVAQTDVLRVTFNTAGADVRRAELLQYPRKQDQPSKPVALLNAAKAGRLVLQTGLNTLAGPHAPGRQVHFKARQSKYRLSLGQNKLNVRFTWRNNQGLEVEKIYTLTRGSYQVGLRTIIRNNTAATWRGSQYLRFLVHNVPRHQGIFSTHRYAYTRAAFEDAKGYEPRDFSDLETKPFSATVRGGWAAVGQQYFLAAVIPEATSTNHYYSKALGGSHYLIGAMMNPKAVAPGQSATFDARLFLGPKLQDRLAGIAPGLDRTVDYGKVTIIAQPVFWVLHHINMVLGNWGWSIILLTILIKILFYYPSVISYRSMAKMRQVQPRLKALQERYKDDKQRLQQAMMEFYKREKINPASGCWPMLLQMPIYFALYYVLVESVELRQAPWVLWIHDLSAPDPYYVLPALYCIGAFLQQRLNPQLPDKMQARLMMMMPLGMIAFAVVMPAGLVLYWVVNMLLNVAQQQHIYRNIGVSHRAHQKAS